MHYNKIGWDKRDVKNTELQVMIPYIFYLLRHKEGSMKRNTILTGVMALLFSITLVAQAQNVVFSVEGPLDGSAAGTLDENDIHVAVIGAVPAYKGVAAGGKHSDLLAPFQDVDTDPVGLDALDVISQESPGGAIEHCFWSSEIDFNAFTNSVFSSIDDGDLLAKIDGGTGYYIENQTLRFPFQFNEILETESIGLDAIDVANMDEAKMILLGTLTDTDRALGSTTSPFYAPDFTEFTGLVMDTFWVFWSFETTNEIYTLSPASNVWDPYTATQIVAGTPISADDLLMTIFTSAGPLQGYLIRSGLDNSPGMVESLFQPNTGPAIGLDSVDLPEMLVNSLGNSSVISFPYYSSEAPETGPSPWMDQIFFSTSIDSPYAQNGDIIIEQVIDGLANDGLVSLLLNAQFTEQIVDQGLDGLDMVSTTVTKIDHWELF